jgi:hypothetical protein
MKRILCLVMLMASAGEALAYTYTFYNTTNAPVYLDYYFDRLSVDNEQAMQGVDRIEWNPYQMEWSTPVRLKGPVMLLPNKRYVFKNKQPWNIGLCFNRLHLGPTVDDIKRAPVKIAPSDQFNAVMDAANKFTGKVSSAAKDVGEAAGQFGAKGKQAQVVATSSGKAAESLVSGITSLLTISLCGDLDFAIATDDNGRLVAIIEK